MTGNSSQVLDYDSIDPDSISKSVKTRRYAINYHEVGAGSPVILLHGSGPGATGWSNFWRNIGPLSRNHRVLAVDMPGWGKSDTLNAEGGYDHSAVLIDFMDEVGLERASLVGNSMGGATSLRTAALHPERVSHLVAMGSPTPGPSYFGAGDELTEGLKVLFAAYADPSPANMKALVNIMCYDKAMATDQLAQLRSEAALSRPDHLASFRERRVDLGFDGLLDLLPGLTTPSLFIHGRDDRVIHYENSLRMVSIIPNSRLVLLNRCGHWAQIEHADEFNRLVEDFISNN